MRRRIPILILVIVSAPIAWGRGRTPIDVILVAGQSNAVGFDSDPAALPSDPRDRQILFWWRCGDPPPSEHDSSSGGRWERLQPQPKGHPLPFDEDRRQFGNFSHAAGGFGPEMGLARTLASLTQRRLAVVKVAYSGTGLHSDWDPRNAGTSGACYRSLVAETREALRSLQRAGFDPSLRAIAWIQGESDCKAEDAGRYRSRLVAFIGDLRQDLDSPGLFFLMGFNDRFNGPDDPFTKTVAAAQRAIARDVARCAFVDTDGATLANRYHFDAAGNLKIGRLLAEALIDGERSTADAVVRPTELPQCERILRQAGASDAAIARFDQQMESASPAYIAGMEGFLLQLPPEGLADFVGDLNHPPDDRYVPGPDSLPHPGVPKGTILEFTLERSKIFPGTTRTITVYVPAQYKADRPACVYVGLDGLAFDAPVVFDNLIYKHQMPVTIGIGIEPGSTEPAGAADDPRFNRSLEFDGLNGNLGRFLLEEVFPEVERLKTHDGLPLLLSRDPNDHAVGGVSTGGIGSFTLAWERPDAFRRVFTGIGTFVGMRGGDRYPVLVRKTEPKPIRIFMQDGSHDELTWYFGEMGDWRLANETMLSALEFAGYSVEHVWGEGSHNLRHPTAIFPDAMRWLWKDWPKPVAAGQSRNNFLRGILLPGQGWQAVPGGYRACGPLAADGEGELVFRDVDGRSWKIAADGRLDSDSELAEPYAGVAFGADGRAYVCDPMKSRIVAYGADGEPSTIAQGIRGLNLVVTSGNALYVTEPGGCAGDSGKVWLIKPDGKRLLLDHGLNHPSGIALSPDGLWLAVAESRTHWGYSYRVRPDGTLEAKEQFYWFHVPDDAEDSGAGAWAFDREGRLYAATRMGVQVFDRNGRVRAIIPVPGGEVTDLSFGGEDFATLYVTCGNDVVYRRKLKVPGQPPWAAPVALPLWGPG